MREIMMNKRLKGFSLIELMVAMVIGLIVLLGLVSVFTNSSILNRAQTGLAKLQENGRYAIMRMKQDIESAGRRHCASVGMPNDFITNWNQGYAMSYWTVANSVDFASHGSTNGLPLPGDVMLDTLGNELDQLGDTAPTVGIYPLDSSFFIRGHECGTSCDPAVAGVVGADAATDFRNVGSGDGQRPQNTDILTLRYLSGGVPVTGKSANQFNLLNAHPNSPTGPAVIADCNTSLVANATWSGANVTLNGNTFNSILGNINENAFTRAYSLEDDFSTVSYFLGVDTDPNNSSKVISSLYRSENGIVQQLVEGVERFDVFYLAQVQTGEVVRLTADQVQGMQGGGITNTGTVSGPNGCIIPARVTHEASLGLNNDQGCLWRSIYAIEIHLLLNTVNDSSMLDNEVYIYSPDSLSAQNPSAGMPNNLQPGRMHRKEFSAIVPVRSYTL